MEFILDSAKKCVFFARIPRFYLGLASLSGACPRTDWPTSNKPDCVYFPIKLVK